MKKPGYFKHPGNGRIFPWNPILANRGDMIPCDVDGNPLTKDRVTQEALSKTVDLGNPEYRKQLEKTNQDEFAHWKSLLEADYDGVAGVLPEWIPARDREEFDEGRARLLSVYTPEQVLEFLELWPKYFKGKPGRLRIVDNDPRKEPIIIKGIQSDDSPFARMEHILWKSIHHLARLKYAVDAGQKEGLRLLGGEYAARGFDAHGSTSRGGKESHKPSRESQDLCLQWADEHWRKEEADGGTITRIGSLSETLWERLRSEAHWHPTSPEKVREWIKQAGKNGDLEIPPDAQKHGRPSNH